MQNVSLPSYCAVRNKSVWQSLLGVVGTGDQPPFHIVDYYLNVVEPRGSTVVAKTTNWSNFDDQLPDRLLES